jgi:hypothetical protein
MEGNGTLPQIGLNLRAIAPAGIEGLDRYRKDWVARSLGQS